MTVVFDDKLIHGIFISLLHAEFSKIPQLLLLFQLTVGHSVYNMAATLGFKSSMHDMGVKVP